MRKWIDSHMRKRLTMLFIILLLITGVTASLKMNISVFPDQPLPSFQIRTAAPGMLAFDVNNQITQPLEEAVRQVGGIEKLTSVSRAGSSVITIKGKVNDLTAWKERLEKKIETASRQLPVDPANVQLRQDNLQTSELGYYLLHGADLATLSEIAEFQVKSQLAQLSGVSKVEIESESVESKLEIQFRPSMLQTYGLTPTDVTDQLRGLGKASQIGEIGEGSDKAYIQWVTQPANPEEIGKLPIATNKGYISLKRLADIRDLRGSQSEQLSLYKSEPFIGIRVYGQEIGQMIAAQNRLDEAVNEINEHANGRFQLTQFENPSTVLHNNLQDMSLFMGILALFSIVIIGLWMRQALASVIAAVGLVTGIAWMLAGLWLFDYGLHTQTIGLISIVAILMNGAGLSLFHRYRRIEEWNETSIGHSTKQALIPISIAFISLMLLMSPFLYTDFIKTADKAIFYLAIPSFIWGAIGLVVVYGFIIPSLTHMWLRPVKAEKAAQPSGKLSNYFAEMWRRIRDLRYMPLGISLVSTVLIVVFCKPFVITQPFTQLEQNQMSLSLEMVEGSKVEDAFKAEKFIEEKLRTFPEVIDLIAAVSKDEIQLQIKMVDRYDRTRSKGQFDKELKNLLLNVPGIKTYDLAGGDEDDEIVEFTVKGTSLATTKTLADQLAYRVARYPILTRMPYQDPFVTQVKTSYEGKLKQLNFLPRTDVLARYEVSEAAIKDQLQSYLGEHNIGTVRWNDKDTQIVAKFPDQAMQHPDQINNLLIHTLRGVVPFKDLVSWELTPSAEEYNREDGMYLIKITGVVDTEFTSAEQIYAALPRIKKFFTTPTGYSILTGEDVRKQEKEKAEEKDVTTRVLISCITVLFCLGVSAVGLRRVTPALTLLLTLPLFAASSVLGLLIIDRPLSMTSMYGLIGAVGLMLQQGYLLINQMESEKAVRLSLPLIGAVLVTGLIASIPLALGWGTQEDFHAPFAATFSFGLLLSGWILIGLLPGLYPPMAQSSLHQSVRNADLLQQQVKNWWVNGQIKRRDARALKRTEKANKLTYQESSQQKETGNKKHATSLSPEDFLPLNKMTE
ncbi:efflux RND transporter permease subunit [Brevibacillus sp. SYSU BS000544]|uniref:efflux RND transporter permease subunit n=1 Tax=Brevibacillus sp. SYSU BS000544 TaxID=3416443 RepID=UPI003CE5B840